MNSVRYTKTGRLWLYCFLLLICSTKLMAWDSVGHRLVAQVAYDQLTPEKQKRVDQLISVLAPYYPNSDTFVKAATWADNLRFHDVSAFNPWHYIAIPYSTDGSELIPPDPVNIVWAIENATKALKSKRANKLEKAIFLRFLIHFLADIHQPLHCADLYSKKFPEGDKGGNLFRIDNKEFHQLHAFWDASLGEYSKRRLLTGRQIKRIAAKLEKKYPKQKFIKELGIISPEIWSEESHDLAIKYAYKLDVGSKPSKEYVKQGQKIAEQRLVLAGYRLAKLLNEV